MVVENCLGEFYYGWLNSRGQVTIYTKQYKSYADYKNGIENKGQVNILGMLGLVYLIGMVVVLLVMFQGV